MARTPHTAEFKKKVALEALREDKTLAQIASDNGVHPVQVSKWKKQLLDGALSIFADPKKARRAAAWDQEVHERKIGQMTIEMDYLKKNSGSGPEREGCMDREKSPRPLDQGAVQFDRTVASQLLLPKPPRGCPQSRADETHRRDCPAMALE